ncbi:MAG: hypothetical protein AAF827_20510 [Cyanobacteria bacterium P01_D01_bin.6]
MGGGDFDADWDMDTDMGSDSDTGGDGDTEGDAPHEVIAEIVDLSEGVDIGYRRQVVSTTGKRSPARDNHRHETTGDKGPESETVGVAYILTWISLICGGVLLLLLL